MDGWLAVAIAAGGGKGEMKAPKYLVVLPAGKTGIESEPNGREAGGWLMLWGIAMHFFRFRHKPRASSMSCIMFCSIGRSLCWIATAR